MVTGTKIQSKSQILRNQLRMAQSGLRDARDRHNYELIEDYKQEIRDILNAIQALPLDGQEPLPGVLNG